MTRVRRLRWLSHRVFTLELDRPPGFAFQPGQSALVRYLGLERSYSIASGRDDDMLLFCIRCVPDGALSPKLAGLSPGDSVGIEGPRRNKTP